MRWLWLLALLSFPSVAYADGLPLLGVDAGPTGVVGKGNRYVTLSAGGDTLVAVVRPEGGQVTRSRLLRGRYTIPAVAEDGSASGLSADGTRLVLISPRIGFPRRSTEFVSLDTSAGLKLGKRIRLRGDYSFDAISPDGWRMYLVHYTSARDLNRYDVVSYDLRANRLEPDPIVDPREPEEKMRGYPLSRATSADGRWAYTLYDGAGGEPFIHALDTSGRTAACVDLELLAKHPDKWALTLRRDGSSLRVVDSRRTVALVETGTWRVSPPGAAARRAPTNGSNEGVPGWVWVLSAAGALALGALLFRHRPGLLLHSNNKSGQRVS